MCRRSVGCNDADIAPAVLRGFHYIFSPCCDKPCRNAPPRCSVLEQRTPNKWQTAFSNRHLEPPLSQLDRGRLFSSTKRITTSTPREDGTRRLCVCCGAMVLWFAPEDRPSTLNR